MANSTVPGVAASLVLETMCFCQSVYAKQEAFEDSPSSRQMSSALRELTVISLQDMKSSSAFHDSCPTYYVRLQG